MLQASTVKIKFYKLIAFLKRKEEGYQKLHRQNINKFTAVAPGDKYLMFIRASCRNCQATSNQNSPTIATELGSAEPELTQIHTTGP
ncbi:hypothetical protein NQ317_016515 [Molorchus minor]|uniref:Uncharacterized protein n=1 Tax=Molorchus minor TaxID=1323400 RepID=A0ABQ9JC34_9CUCU|nr:hypothetical protein NQ317_016515 [Molorchus minor]